MKILRGFGDTTIVVIESGDDVAVGFCAKNFYAEGQEKSRLLSFFQGGDRAAEDHVEICIPERIYDALIDRLHDYGRCRIPEDKV